VKRALLLSLLLTPGIAQAELVGPFADAILIPPDAFTEGAFGGNEDARRVWNDLGQVRPFDGGTLAAFSTGALERPAIPGTDLGTPGPDGDSGVQLRLSLDPPPWARSIRYAVTAVAPAFYGPGAAPAIEADACRVVIQGEGVSLDPWNNSQLLQPTSAAFEQPLDSVFGNLSWLDGMHATSWVEGIHPLSGPPDSLIFEFHIADGGPDPGYDFICLLDGVRFDRAHPVSRPPPGVIPFIETTYPATVPEAIATDIVLVGRDLLSTEAAYRVVYPDGTFSDPLPVIAPTGGSPSTERVRLRLPALADTGAHGLRLEWGADNVLEWSELIQVNTPPPRIVSVVPANGPLEGGNRVVVTGVGFHDVRLVSFGGRDALSDSIHVLSPQQLEVVVPASGGAPDAGSVLVAVRAGSQDSPLEGLYQFAAPLPPPEEEPLAGGPTLACSQSEWAPTPWLLLIPLLVATRRGASPARTPRQGRSASPKSAPPRAPGTFGQT
jgi:hypothetical protein